MGEGPCLGFRVLGFGFRLGAQGLGLRVWGLGFGAWGLDSLSGLGLRVWGLRFELVLFCGRAEGGGGIVLWSRRVLRSSASIPRFNGSRLSRKKSVVQG